MTNGKPRTFKRILLKLSGESLMGVAIAIHMLIFY